MNRKVLLVGILFLALGIIGMLSHPAIALGQEGAVLTGGWIWQINLDVVFPGAVLPSLLIFHNDGTCFCSDAVAFGGTPTNVFRYTPFYGVWERTGPHEFTATIMSLRFDTTKGNILVGIGRSRATFAFTTDWDHMAGTMHMDFLPCVGGNPLMCPNPLLAQESDWEPWSTTMPSDFSFTCTRVSVVPY
jgi:hypothetical protein